MLEMVCDRCGKRQDLGQNGKKDYASFMMERRLGSSPLAKGYDRCFTADLCWDCEEELTNWFKEKKETFSSVGISPDEFHSICEDIVKKLKESDSDQTVNKVNSISESMNSIIFGDDVLKPENSKPEKYVSTVDQEELKEDLLPMDEPASCF